jgi:hypothetical protein
MTKNAATLEQNRSPAELQQMDRDYGFLDINYALAFK